MTRDGASSRSSSARRCPLCMAVLSSTTGGDLACGACGVVFPVVESVPVWVEAADVYLCQSLASISETCDRLETTIRSFSRVPTTAHLAFRRGLVERAVSGLELNLRLARSQRDALWARTTIRTRARYRVGTLASRWRGRVARAMPPGVRARWVPEFESQVGYDFDAALVYLLADWANSPESVAQRALVGSIVSEYVTKCPDASGSALYLGAGLGRYAFEAAYQLAHVTAIDLAFSGARLVAELRRSPIQFCRLNLPGAICDADVAQVHTVSFPERLATASNVDYMIADAVRLPLADESQAAVVAIFFADVVPMSKFMPEVRRVLRPGGSFINFGPLQYHSKDPSEWLTSEEVRHVLGSTYRMDLEMGDQWVDVPYAACPPTPPACFLSSNFVATTTP